jgi:hypothetical protein
LPIGIEIAPAVIRLVNLLIEMEGDATIAIVLQRLRCVLVREEMLLLAAVVDSVEVGADLAAEVLALPVWR